MKKILFTILFLTFSGFSLFAQTKATTKQGKKVILYDDGTWKYEVTKVEKAESKEYIEIPFKKIISPAFADENQGRWVHFKAKFLMLNPAAYTSIIPVEYRTNYVGITLVDVEDVTATTYYCSIPKDKSDIIFELKTNEIIEIWAHLIPLTSGPPYIEVEKVSKELSN